MDQWILGKFAVVLNEIKLIQSHLDQPYSLYQDILLQSICRNINDRNVLFICVVLPIFSNLVWTMHCVSTSSHFPGIKPKYANAAILCIWSQSLQSSSCGIYDLYCSQPLGGDWYALASLLGSSLVVFTLTHQILVVKVTQCIYVQFFLYHTSNRRPSG